MTSPHRLSFQSSAQYDAWQMGNPRVLCLDEVTYVAAYPWFRVAALQYDVDVLHYRASRHACLAFVSTGLDSTTAFEIMLAVQVWAKGTGGTVVASLLQVSRLDGGDGAVTCCVALQVPGSDVGAALVAADPGGLLVIRQRDSAARRALRLLGRPRRCDATGAANDWLLSLLR